MRIIFMGSPQFAVPSLEALVEAGHEVVAAYAQPPRPAGRGKAERKTAVHERAEQLGIEVRTPRTLRDPEEQERFRALDADLAVVAAYGLILPPAILEAPKGGCINVHASLLPRWRGAAPIQRAILAGDEVSGITLMKMDEGLDTGPMLLKRELTLAGKNTGQVILEMGVLGADLLLEWLDHPTPPEPQPESGATYAAKIDKAEARIDWGNSAEAIERQVRALSPSPGAFFEIGGERIKVLEAKVLPMGGEPGEIIDDQLAIATGGAGSIWPSVVQRGGKSPMATDDFLRGFPVQRYTFVDGYEPSR